MQIVESCPNPSNALPDRTLSARRVFALKRADLRDLNFIGWAMFAMVLTIAAHQSLHESEPRDFVYFYTCGYLLNHYSSTHLYDHEVQLDVLGTVYPQAVKVGGKIAQPNGGFFGSYSYPPYVAMMFQPFAKLPYWTACRLWLALSLTLYLTGLCLVIRRFCDRDLLQRSMFFLFGLSFWPFIPWILLGGQLSAIGFLAMALAIYWEDLGCHFLSGLALSICTYKPTLLLLILPMLLVIRRPRTLAGLAVGAFTLIASATLALGPQIWVSFIGESARKVTEISQIPVTLDLKAFAGAVPHAGRLMRSLFICVGALAGAYLARIWWKARSYARRGPATLVWATTITWTLLLNLYVPVYDSVLVLISIIATAAILIRFAPRLFFGLCLALLISSYFTVWLSIQIGWQILTPLLAAIGILQMSACMNVSNRIGSGIALAGKAGG